MKRIIFILLFVLTSPMLAQTKISSYTWNGRTYTQVLCSDGTKVEVKGSLGMKDAEAFIRAEAIAAAIKVVPAPDHRTPLSAYATAEKLATISDAELLAEVTRRGLKIDGGAQAMGGSK